MAVYNCERYVKYAIESMLNQSFSDFEFIIINDASTDKTGQIIESFKDSRIVYVRNKENIGQTGSLNNGIKMSRGFYIARMDADDISLPDRLLQQVEFLEKNKDIGVVGSWHQEINVNNKVIRRLRFPTFPNIKARLILLRLVGMPCLSHPTVMIRSKVLNDIGLYNEKYRISQDYDLWLRVSRKYSIENISKILLSYRVHKASLCRRDLKKTEMEIEDIIASNIKFYLPNINSEEKIALVNMLTCRKQMNSKDGKLIFEIFDKFYKTVMDVELKRNDELSDRYFSVNEMAKFFYLPQLFRTNRVSALNKFVRLFTKYPNFFFSRRFAGAVRYVMLHG